MSKICMVNREVKRRKVANRYAAKRAELKKLIQNPKTGEDQRQAAMQQLHNQPRDASPCRQRNRCRITGRPRGYYRKFGLARTKLREAVMRGDVPGVHKASW